MNFNNLYTLLMESFIKENFEDKYYDMREQLTDEMFSEFRKVNAKWLSYCKKKDIDPTEFYDRITKDGYGEFFNKPINMQKWDLLKLNDVLGQWTKWSSNRELDPDVIIEMSNLVARNIIKMELNNIVTGHTSSNPEDEFETQFSEDVEPEEMELEFNKMSEWVGDRISDYGMKPLEKQLEIILMNISDSSQESLGRQLMAIDEVFNVIHARSDMAGNFIEGGRNSLDKLAGNRP